MLWLVIFSMLSFTFADSGKVLDLSPNSSSYVIRGDQKLSLVREFQLSNRDEIKAEGSSVQFKFGDAIFILLRSSSVSLGPGKIFLNEGSVVVKAAKETLVEAPKVSFTASEATFSLMLSETGAEVDVEKGEVTVSSPLIMTFVPEIVKAQQGLRFDQKEKKYIRRKFKRVPKISWKQG